MEKLTLKEFFDKHYYLSQTGIAKKAGIHRALLSHYISELKTPSDKALAKIEKAIHDIGLDLSKASL